jgi:ribosome-associated heat shock protein Hsp15
VDSTRIDKWLWAARFFKTRSLATDAAAGGKVHVGGERVKPSREVKVGETVEVTVGPHRRTVVVTGIADRRGSAAAAAALYEETAESLARREQVVAERRLTQPVFETRPSKQDRRRLEALRRSMNRRP